MGFHAQLKGKLTKKRYKYTIIFVDHFSHLRFVNLQLDAFSEEKMATKNAFEQFAAEHGVKILCYHYDNGHFHDNVFSRACQDAKQKVTICGVNAYFQHGIAKRAILDLSESVCKQLLQAHACWLETMHFALWTYALCTAMHLHNSLPVLEDGTLRLEP